MLYELLYEKWNQCEFLKILSLNKKWGQVTLKLNIW